MWPNKDDFTEEYWEEKRPPWNLENKQVSNLIVTSFQKLTQRLMVNKHVLLICNAKCLTQTTDSHQNNQFVILWVFLFPIASPWERCYISVKEQWETLLENSKITDCRSFPQLPEQVPGSCLTLDNLFCTGNIFPRFLILLAVYLHTHSEFQIQQMDKMIKKRQAAKRKPRSFCLWFIDLFQSGKLRASFNKGHKWLGNNELWRWVRRCWD